MSSSPHVSVILPTYNRPGYLREAIESVLVQTYRDWELIIIDDGSTDETHAVAQSYVKRDPRILYHYYSNQGEGASRNAGIRLARGRYIGFLDDDDLWLPKKLEWQLDALNRHQTAPWIFGDGELINDRGEVLRPVLPQRRVAFTQWMTRHRTQDAEVSVGSFHDVLLTGNCLAVPAVLVKRDCFAEVGLFNPSYEIGTDYDIWLRVAQRYPVILLRRPVVKIRVHDGAVSGGSEIRPYRWHEATARVLEAHQPRLTSEQRRTTRHVIAGCRRTAGWYYLRTGDSVKARSLLWSSLHYRWAQPKVMVHLVTSCWPVPVYGWLRQLKSSIGRRMSSTRG